MDEIIGRAIITTITTILMIVTARIIVFKIYTKGDGKYAEGKVIRFPAVFFWVGLLGSLLFGVTLIMTIIDGEKMLWEYLIIFLFVLLGLTLITLAVNWKIVLFKDTFIYRTAFRRTYTFRYKDVERYIRKKGILFMKVQKKWLIIDPDLPDIDCFLNRIRIKPRK